MILRTIVIIYVGLLSFYSSAQHSLTGDVRDASSGEPLPGANIFIPELQRGTVSGPDGAFSIAHCPKGKFMMRISYMGFETEIIHLHLESDTTLHYHLRPSAVQSEEIVITGGRPSAQHENAIKIEMMTMEKISGTGAYTLTGSLAETPGVDVISRGAGVVTPVIRGLSTSNILFLNNGFRMENFQFSEGHPYLVSEAGINRVEIIKGPASLLYGSDAMGGVINMVPEEPALPASLEGNIDLRYFGNTEGYSGAAGLKGTHRDWYWGVNGSAVAHADYLQGNNEFVPNSRFNGGSAKAFAGHTGTRSSTRLGYEYQKMNLGMTVDESVDLVKERGRGLDVWYQDLDHHIVMLRSKLFYDQWKIGLNGAYQFSHRKLNGSFLTPEFNLVDMRLHTFLYEGKSTYASSDCSEFTLALQGMSQVNRNGDAPEHVLPDYSLNDISLFGMVQHDFNRRWHIQVGLRFDNRFLDVPEQERTAHDHGAGDPGGEEEEDEILEALERYYGNLSGSLGATYRLTHDLLLRGNLASAYRTPNIAELTQDGVHETRYEQGDRNLAAQRNFEGDLSLHYHRENFMLDVSGFYNYVLGYIHLSPTADTAEDGDRIFRYLQEDAALYGTEIIAEVIPVGWMKLLATYSLVRGFQTDETPLSFIPQDKLNLQAAFEWRAEGIGGKIRLNAGTIIAFGQNEPSPYETATSGYTVFYASAGADLGKTARKVQIDLTVKNILNRTYYDHLSLLKEMGYYDMGRSIMVNLRVPLSLSL